MNLPAQQPFWFDLPRISPPKDASGAGGSDCQLSPHWPSRGRECNRCWRDQRLQSPQFPSPSPDHGFKSDRSSLSMVSSMLSRSHWSDRSQCPRRGRWHQEEGACILDENYNSMKAHDVLNQELFQLWMADKETVSDWIICLSRHLQVLAASFPDHFPPDCVAELKRDHFYSRLPKQLKVMVAYLKVGLQVRMYSDYLRTAREAEKEDSIELPEAPEPKLLMAP